MNIPEGQVETMTVTVDTQALETKVKDMYRHVAQQPHDRFHF